jgi:diaminopimelate epimerase
MRTYERGVENETLSCGTGAVASAIATFLDQNLDNNKITCHVPGGELIISFTKSTDGGFTDIFLTGPAHQVFEGKIEI